MFLFVIIFIGKEKERIFAESFQTNFIKIQSKQEIIRRITKLSYYGNLKQQVF